MSEAFRTAAVLALAGGFLETYTFVLHGKVFANAQTGNIALCGMSLSCGNWEDSLKYLIPILSFVAGVGLVELVRQRWQKLSLLHWRQLMVLIEALILSACFFLPSGSADRLANLIVSVACALQVQTFRKIHGAPFASTMCTGNLRSLTIAWISWRRTGQKDALRQVLHLGGIIAVFLLGAAIALPFIDCLREKSVVLPLLLLVTAIGLMSIPPKARA